MNVQNLFTKLRTLLNDREDVVLQEIDNYFNINFYSEKDIKEGEKLPNKIKVLLEKGKKMEKNWEVQPLNFNINDCSIIENTIKESTKIRENLKNCNLNFNDKLILLEGNEINLFNELIKSFGNLNLKNYFNSNIKFDQKSVKSWLNNRDFTSELLFRKTRDGSTSDDFHKHCDNKGIAITFIETTKGYKFGGYLLEIFKIKLSANAVFPKPGRPAIIIKFCF